MQATDAGTPAKADTCVVTVNVNRNLKAPRMRQTQYTVKILETQDLGVSFLQVHASDDDQKVLVPLFSYNFYRTELVGLYVAYSTCIVLQVFVVIMHFSFYFYFRKSRILLNAKQSVSCVP